jgi:hypothetical protein
VQVQTSLLRLRQERDALGGEVAAAQAALQQADAVKAAAIEEAAQQQQEAEKLRREVAAARVAAAEAATAAERAAHEASAQLEEASAEASAQAAGMEAERQRWDSLEAELRAALAHAQAAAESLRRENAELGSQLGEARVRAARLAAAGVSLPAPPPAEPVRLHGSAFTEAMLQSVCARPAPGRELVHAGTQTCASEGADVAGGGGGEEPRGPRAGGLKPLSSVPSVARGLGHSATVSAAARLSILVVHTLLFAQAARGAGARPGAAS